MKKHFFEFYPLSEKEIDSIWSGGIISFDANVLINLYRYTEKTRDDFFKVIASIKIEYGFRTKWHWNIIITGQKSYLI